MAITSTVKEGHSELERMPLHAVRDTLLLQKREYQRDVIMPSPATSEVQKIRCQRHDFSKAQKVSANNVSMDSGRDSGGKRQSTEGSLFMAVHDVT